MLRLAPTTQGRLMRMTAAALAATCLLASPVPAIADEAPAADVALEAQATTRNISKCTVTVAADNLRYDGNAKKPVVTVKYGTTTLVEGTDYTLQYDNNVNATTETSKALVTINAIGDDYEGSTTESFDILPFILTSKNAEVAEIDEQVYTGSEIRPTVTVTATVDGTRQSLLAGVDYLVSYVNNTALTSVSGADARVIVEGTNNYIGTIEQTFKIVEKSSKKTNKATGDGEVKRLSGTDRYKTMSKIVEEGFSGSEWAVVASGDDFPDALTASSLAGVREAPVILTSKNSLSAEARTQLKDLGVEKVYIVGGTGSVSSTVENSIENMDIDVTRVAGTDRIDTSVKALLYLRAAGSESDTVIIATGSTFADALSIGPWSYAKGAPIILASNDGTLTDDAVKAIKDDEFIKNVLIVGGTNSVSDNIKTQIGTLSYTYERRNGVDRYATSRSIMAWASLNGLDYSAPCVATGASFPDALTGAALAGINESVLLLATSTTDSTVTELVSHKDDVATCYVLGGESSVSSTLFDYLKLKIEPADA